NTPQTVSSTIVGQVFDLIFSGTAGQVVSLAATNNNYPCYDMVLSIVKPDGTNLVSSGVCGNRSEERRVGQKSGTQRVQENSLTYTGCVTLTWLEIIRLVLPFNTPQTVSSTLAGQVFDLTFSGTAGQVVSLAATNNNYPCYDMVLSIVKPDGTNLVSSGVCGN